MLKFINKSGSVAFTTTGIARVLRVKTSQLSDRLHKLAAVGALYRSPNRICFFSNSSEYIYSLDRGFIMKYFFELLRKQAPSIAAAYEYVMESGPATSVELLQKFGISEPNYRQYFNFFFSWGLLKKKVVPGFCDLIARNDFPDSELEKLYEKEIEVYENDTTAVTLSPRNIDVFSSIPPGLLFVLISVLGWLLLGLEYSYLPTLKQKSHRRKAIILLKYSFNIRLGAINEKNLFGINSCCVVCSYWDSNSSKIPGTSSFQRP